MNIYIKAADLAGLKSWTTCRYYRYREAGLRRVKAHIGNRPERHQFQRALGPNWIVVDPIAHEAFTATLTNSSVHKNRHNGAEDQAEVR